MQLQLVMRDWLRRSRALPLPFPPDDMMLSIVCHHACNKIEVCTVEAKMDIDVGVKLRESDK